MATDGLLVTEDERDGIWTLGVLGDVDLGTAPDLCAHLGAHRGEQVVVDLTQVRFCDSAGLRALLGEARETRFLGGVMTLVATPGTAVWRLLELTGLIEVLGVREDRAAALP